MAANKGEVNHMKQADRPLHIIEQIRGFAYMSDQQLATEFNMSKRTVQRKRRGIEDEMEKGRYNKYAIVGALTNVYVFIDYIKFEKTLKNPILRKCIPDFEPEEIMRICGYSQQMRLVPEN